MGMAELHVNLQLLRETNRPQRHCNDDQSASLHSGDEQIPLDSYEDMLRLEGPGKKRILVTAETGYGKSTLFKKIAYDWAVLQQTQRNPQTQRSPLSKYKLVFLLNINLMVASLNIIDAIFSQILPDSNPFTKQDLKTYMQKYPEEVLILLDGADEVSFQTLDGATGVDNVKGVLSFKSLKSCRVIVTSRRLTALKLLKWFPHFTRVSVTGFNDANRQEYVSKYLTNYDSKYQSKLLKEVRESQTLRTLGEIPLLFWLMCTTWEKCLKLPDRVTKLFHAAIRVLYQHRVSKRRSPDTFTKETFADLMTKLGRVAIAGLLNSNGVRVHFRRAEFDSEDLVTLGCEVGLLSHTRTMHGLDAVDHVTFLHKTFQEYCAAAYLEDLATSNPRTFRQYVSQILEDDAESMEYLLRFCCGMNTNAAEIIIRLVNEKLTGNDLDTFYGFLDNYMSLNRIMMLLLFEAELDRLVNDFSEAEWVGFPCMLKGEDLLAAHYFVKTLSKPTRLPHASDISVTCHSLADVRLVTEMMHHGLHTTSLDLHGTNMNDKVDKLKDICKHLNSLFASDCNLDSNDIIRLFRIISATGSVHSIDISENNLCGLLSGHQIVPIPSVTSLNLSWCSLTNRQMEALFLLLSSALSSTVRVVLTGNNLHGLQPVQICHVFSLQSLILSECGLTKSDIKPLFSMISAAGNIKWVNLRKNNLHGLRKVSCITPVPSLLSLDLTECSLNQTDANALLGILACLSNIQRVSANDNELDSAVMASVGLIPSPESKFDVPIFQTNEYIRVFSDNTTYVLSRDKIRQQNQGWFHSQPCKCSLI